ncbi:hypothetical protein GJ496_002204 [Pomphorhynchus laevis]|nr:hypothetical protein GJ496_002204 [Pomphorhynchus laevis]
MAGRSHQNLHRYPGVRRNFDAYSSHKNLINNYLLYYKKKIKQSEHDGLQKLKSPPKSEFDLAGSEHRFLWHDKDDDKSTWEVRLARRYYDRLFKEYAICDLSRAEKDKEIGMRWRTETEVVTGKGQFVCGERKCNNDIDLTSWEVNFAYIEKGEKRNALVKIRLCIDCSLLMKTTKIHSTDVTRTVDTDQILTSDPLKVVDKIEEANEKAIISKNPESIWKESNYVDDEQLRQDAMDKFLDNLFL